MKSFLSQALLVALAATATTATTFGQTEAKTTPVGYVTETLKAGKYNLIGLTMHEAVLVSGTFESKTSSELVDNQGSFGSLLTAGSTYLLEISSGTIAGAVQDFTSWNGSSITNLPADFLSSLNGAETYSIRKSATIGSIFGVQNQSGLLAGNANTADLILLPNGSGGFVSYYYSSGGFAGVGWRKVGGNAVDYSNQPVVYTDAVMVYRRGITDLSLNISGVIKTSNTLVGVSNGYEYLGGVYPVGSTFASSGLSSRLLWGNANTADLVMLPDGAGGYVSYYYSSGGFAGVGWRRVGSGSADVSSAALTSGVIICRRQANSFNAGVAAPPMYSDL